MTISQITSLLSELSSVSQENLEPRILAYFQERFRNRLYELVIEEFEKQQRENGLTQRELAQRINKSVSRVNKWLRTPGNWTLDTVSDLLIGISKSELKISSKEITPPSLNFIGWSGLYVWESSPEPEDLINLLHEENTATKLEGTSWKAHENSLIKLEFTNERHGKNKIDVNN